MLTKYNQVLAFLGFATRLTEKDLNFDVWHEGLNRGSARKLLEKGEPCLYSLSMGKISNCYHSHTDICFNYNGSAIAHPYGMCGLVTPYQTGEVAGVPYALFRYSIDSGG